jgi:hypothetical protein
MEAFLSRLMDENAVPNDLMDEENYLYDSEGRVTNISCFLSYEMHILL